MNTHSLYCEEDLFLFFLIWKAPIILASVNQSSPWELKLTFCRHRRREKQGNKTKHFTCFCLKGKRVTVQSFIIPPTRWQGATENLAWGGNISISVLRHPCFQETFALIKDREQSAGIFYSLLKLIFSQGTFRHSTKMGSALPVTSGMDCLWSASHMGWTVAHTSPPAPPPLPVALSVIPHSSFPTGRTKELGSLGTRTAYRSDLAGLPNGELGVIPQFLSQQTCTPTSPPLPRPPLLAL